MGEIAYLTLAPAPDWGDGITESSRETRRRVVADYYRPPRPVSNDHPGTEPAA